ncbi:hypothetical protein [Dechloromonas hortensis]|uniref:hypothetical protein n=1 Tax=Dechloromonas hortensis TaxID=337779 RepID=UPI0012916036|nr:hypothetical protein [Dechloromonas hortensis]
MNRHEAHDRTWLVRGTVRSLRPCTAFHFIGLALDPAKPDAEHRYTATDITHLGINNLSATEEDFIYHAVARGNQDAPEAAPDVRLVIEQKRENAIKIGITPLTQDEVLKLARQIPASVGPRKSQ